MSNRIDEINRQTQNKAVIDKKELSQKLLSQRIFHKELLAKKHDFTNDLSARAESSFFEKFQVRPKPEDMFDRRLLDLPKQSEDQTVQEEETLDLEPQGFEAERDLLPLSQRKEDSKNFNDGFGESDSFFQNAADFGIQSLPSPDGPHQPILSEEVINELIERIQHFTALDGSSEITIELRSGVLSGARIKICAQGKEIGLQLSVANPKTKTLLRNSKAILEERLAKKNISVTEFVVH